MNTVAVKDGRRQAKFNATLQICKEIMRQDGFAGFYRGYTASLCAYVPNSALWWAFYHFYQGKLSFNITLPYRYSLSTFTGTLTSNRVV